MKILFFLFISFANAQSVTWTEKVLIPDTVLNNASKSATYSFAASSGFSLQTNITCAGACSVIVKISGSVDGINYSEITDLTKTYIATTTALYNVYMQFFQWMKVDIQESSGNNATVKAIIGSKLQI